MPLPPPPIPGVTTIERAGRRAIVHLHGDLVGPTAGRTYGELRALVRQREIHGLVLDFAGAGRLDSAGIAVVSLIARQAARGGKTFDVTTLADHHRAALALMPQATVARAPAEPRPGALEQLGEGVLGAGTGLRHLVGLIGETLRQGGAVLTGRRRLPAGALAHQVATMGVDALFIVGLLSFLLGMTMAFQGAVQLQRFGAGVFVADMVGVSTVRELAPLMTAVILTARTGAAIAAELGTMRVRSEIDALTTMGINPARFLILPRLAAITFVGPALTLAAMFIGMFGGMMVAVLTLDMAPLTFWQRLVERLTLADFAHGLGKSLLFAWIILFTGSHFGMRASGDASSVGAATTRTVVVTIIAIMFVDAMFATISTMVKYG